MLQIAMSLLLSASLLLTQANDPKLSSILTPEYKQAVQNIALQAISYAQSVLNAPSQTSQPSQPTQSATSSPDNVAPSVPSVPAPVTPIIPSVQPPVQAIVTPPEPVRLIVQPVVTVVSVEKQQYVDHDDNGIADCSTCFQSTPKVVYHIHFETNRTTTANIILVNMAGTMNQDTTITGTIFDYDFYDIWAYQVWYSLHIDGLPNIEKIQVVRPQAEKQTVFDHFCTVTGTINHMVETCQ